MAVDARQKHTCKLTKNTIPRTEVCGVINRSMIWYVEGGGNKLLLLYVSELLLTTEFITCKNKKIDIYGIHVDTLILSVTSK